MNHNYGVLFQGTRNKEAPLQLDCVNFYCKNGTIMPLMFFPLFFPLNFLIQFNSSYSLCFNKSVHWLFKQYKCIRSNVTLHIYIGRKYTMTMQMQCNVQNKIMQEIRHWNNHECALEYLNSNEHKVSRRKKKQ